MASEQDTPYKVPPGDIEIVDGIAWYRGSRPFEELDFPPVPPELEEDYQWAFHDPDVRRQYGGRVIAFRHRTIWGAGKSYREANEQARKNPGCPPGELLFLVV
jgi:hypothetical protein